MLKEFGILFFAHFVWSQQSCSCNLYGTQEGCLLQRYACTWSQDSQSCSENTTMPYLCPMNATQCGPPYCYQSGENCQYFANCQQVPLNNTQSLEESCSAYNCQVQGSGCGSISNCSAFTNEKHCLGRFYPNSQGEKISCEWDSVTNTCFDFTSCESLNNANQCFAGPDCYFESATGCHQLQCSQYVNNIDGFQASCTPAQCYFNGISCVNKVCSQMNNQTSCDGTQSYQAGVCAWKSGTCQSCWSYFIGISLVIYSLYV